MSREMFTCPHCERPVWLPADAPLDTPCPHCGEMLSYPTDRPIETELSPWDPDSAESIDLTAMVPTVDALESVPEELAREVGVFPIELHEGALVLAVPSDLPWEELDKLQFVLNRHIRPVLAPAEAIRSAIDLWYG